MLIGQQEILDAIASVKLDLRQLIDRIDADRECAKERTRIDKPSGPSPMPEPVEVWSAWTNEGDPVICGCPFSNDDPFLRDISGPHKIIHGMMNLDELAVLGYRIAPVYEKTSIIFWHWKVWFKGKAVSENHPTSSEAQWAATQLVKKIKL